MTRLGKVSVSMLALLLVVTAVYIGSDWLYWDRYLRARTFDSFVENPFPTVDRLYPQETVKGARPARSLLVVAESDRTISADALNRAAAFAEESQSTALLVMHNGVVQFERYWRGASESTPVYSFSMHKSVVSLLVGLAIEDGIIGSVDEPLANYLTEWAGDPRGEITIENALQMNSGLNPMKFVANPFSDHTKRQIGTDIGSVALRFALVDEPGSVYSYNGANPTLLVMVLERATGRRYADYLSEKLWQPVGNADAGVWLDKENGLARGATSLYAIPRDWLRIGSMILNRGRVEGRQIVPESWLQQMLTPSSTNAVYGFLIWLGTEYQEQRDPGAFEGFEVISAEPFVADDVVYFSGLGGQRVYVVPSKNLVIVRMGLLSTEWQETQLPNILIAGLKD